MILQDWCCPEHGSFEALAESSEVDAVPCPTCGAPAPWSPSPVAGRVKLGEPERGGSDERPPFVADTSKLADGQPYHEWKEDRRKERREERRKQIREMLR